MQHSNGQEALFDLVAVLISSRTCFYIIKHNIGSFFYFMQEQFMIVN